MFPAREFSVDSLTREFSRDAGVLRVLSSPGYEISVSPASLRTRQDTCLLFRRWRLNPPAQKREKKKETSTVTGLPREFDFPYLPLYLSTNEGDVVDTKMTINNSMGRKLGRPQALGRTQSLVPGVLSMYPTPPLLLPIHRK